MERRTKTYALLAAFGCALAYLLAGKLLALVPASAAGTRVPAFVHHCVAAPIMEELVFRGAVLRLARPLGARQAVLLQAALFALQHGSPAGMAWALVCGAGLGVLADRTGHVWPGMLLHTLNNLLVFAAG